MTPDRNRTWATLARGQHSHHCTISIQYSVKKQNIHVTDRRRILPFIHHLKNTIVQIGFAFINQVCWHKDSFINKILFYLLLVKMTGTLKSVARQQMTVKLVLQLIAIIIIQIHVRHILWGISQIACNQLMSLTILRNFEN